MDKLSKTAIDKLGRELRTLEPGSERYNEIIKTISDWREQHGEIMNYYFSACKNITEKSFGKSVLVTQRLKRLPTIIDKICNRESSMNLSRLQDVAGIRIITEDIQQLQRLYKEIASLPYLKKSPTDYITAPRSSGYRGVHFIYERDGFLTEVQLRTYLQHLWATTVETVDTFEHLSLKSGSGPKYWQDFFKLVSAIFAYTEYTPVLEQYKNEDIFDLAESLSATMTDYQIDMKFKNYISVQSAIKSSQARNAYYALISLYEDYASSEITYYAKDDYEKATHDYEIVEKDTSSNNVLVSVSQMQEIQEAYPNYFLQINDFQRSIEACLKLIKTL